MRRTTLLVALVLATALTSTESVKASLACREQGVRPITRTTHARVYARCRGRELAYYGQFRTRRPIRLDYPRCCVAVRLASLAGRYVAYVQEQVVNDRDEFSVRVRDLRTGRYLHHWEEGTFGPDPLYYGPSALVLAPTGSAAWITSYNSPDGDPTIRYEVRKSDSTGDAVVLDSGPEIDPRSLARSGATVYWSTDGTPRSAQLK
jgi:hypothetical protein